jgi:hypothetical protein
VKKKIKQSTLRNKLDVLWREDVKQNAGFRCEKCGKQDGKHDCHHIFGKKAHPSVRFDVANGAYLCVGCHKFNKGSAHETPKVFMDWIISKRGEVWYEDLLLRANQLQKVDKAALLESFKK